MGWVESWWVWLPPAVWLILNHTRCPDREVVTPLVLCGWCRGYMMEQHTCPGTLPDPTALLEASPWLHWAGLVLGCPSHPWQCCSVLSWHRW